jgi:uncharacterized protein with GYD domain
MPFYLIQASYSAPAVGAMVKNPQDRAEAIRPMMEKLGCKLQGFWFTFGEYDIVAVAEAPDSVTVAAIAMAIGSTGAMSAYRTTPLLTTGEATEAMKRAAQVAYQPPK